MANKGVQVRKVDFKDIQTVTADAAGVDRVLLISVEDIAGVKHIEYTSLQGLEKSLFADKAKHALTGAAIKSSNIPYTILRNGLYFDNNIGPLAGTLKTGQWFSAANDVKVSLITRAAAYALASDNTDVVTYELTGPEALTFD
ncbi:hypothetical protein AC1031_016031 [Aphanomyces cochlioides]|nr:hypothetical protein AC1031_016031 [Aphanomyces cochlioides]